jgi:hypothetical protein
MIVARRAVGGRLWSGAQAVCEVAVEVLDIDAAALTLFLDVGVQELVATTDDWVEQLEGLQHVLGDGPSMAAFHQDRAVFVADLAAADERWPGFAQFAPGAAGASFSWPIAPYGEPIAVFSGYRRRPGPLHRDATADVVALTVLASRSIADQYTGLPAAVEAIDDGALGHYAAVSVAAEMLAAQHTIDLLDAIALLRAHAFTDGSPLIHSAYALITGNLRLDL